MTIAFGHRSIPFSQQHSDPVTLLPRLLVLNDVAEMEGGRADD